ncbi:uncharacterized protein LOC123877178 isoform X1 [Maniola jurtina]|uniref:uncharacterized protein LOC123877178 isoform X1 n=1 Tax=Maniola jurtina TaxID=191418 RepID=UPI001E68ED95|nr:uncharacterized protein LOC123877178 isoform X1 [Maniola jurtina]XP_045779644.1 uncharacterized protein LOC123877178 isoform X1 [Maniola jurtina]XP_045779645.1 uncharacterized protein LOC123877178 isoform X1 [Maniola jurtina]XP_045779646.1 uncharacterized protein LOC123877178 isoform X1 [Maniola jurtina]XP_045779647.1 uncharacterized protein LOC123877178 isoform X1 [Maniola jurtina]XP_045779648.1 uncharacterized protein LOC123877178 isoform X1 [Maniola jurtina]XP_045779650.1 uncharacterize
MMTISESQFSSNKRSSIHKINDRVVHRDSFDDVTSSSSVNSSLITKRGFKPSDMFDPKKKEFLTNLSYKLFPNDADLSAVELPPPEYILEDLENKPIIVGDKEVDLNKIFTPAPDAEEHIIKKDKKFEKTFASSAFYVPGVHPTVREQMDLARAISKSLSDSSNHMSKGQSMYVNRKKRSVKWVHEGRGRNTSNQCTTATPVANHDTPYRPPSSLRNQKTYPKSALKHTSNIPKMEPFPVTPPYIAAKNVEIPVPVTPTKLNDVYASPKSPRLPLVSGPNFNVAPRGWGEMKDYYRPVALDGIGNITAAYTDY